MSIYDGYMTVYNKAKSFEHDDKWFEAAIEWRKIGRIEDAEACELIVESSREGDEYRQRVGPEPDRNENPHTWVKWYDRKTEIYNEMFKNKTT